MKIHKCTNTRKQIYKYDDIKLCFDVKEGKGKRENGKKTKCKIWNIKLHKWENMQLIKYSMRIYKFDDTKDCFDVKGWGHHRAGKKKGRPLFTDWLMN